MIKEALRLGRESLKEHSNEALFILCEHLKCDRSWLLRNENMKFDAREYLSLVKRFKEGEPFEYIFKKASFWGLEFSVEEGVFIPRYDSEILLTKLIKLCKKYSFDSILEIGFGSGILSIVLAKESGLKITACDINPLALKIAKQNAEKYKLSHLIDFYLMDFKDMDEKFELIFSNPPYIKNSYQLDQWVQREPKNALFGGEMGYEILENIIAYSFKKKARFLACELGYDQREILTRILQKYAFVAEFFKDEGGFDRAFVAQNTHF